MALLTLYITDLQRELYKKLSPVDRQKILHKLRQLFLQEMNLK